MDSHYYSRAFSDYYQDLAYLRRDQGAPEEFDDLNDYATSVNNSKDWEWLHNASADITAPYITPERIAQEKEQDQARLDETQAKEISGRKNFERDVKVARALRALWERRWDNYKTGSVEFNSEEIVNGLKDADERYRTAEGKYYGDLSSFFYWQGEGAKARELHNYAEALKEQNKEKVGISDFSQEIRDVINDISSSKKNEKAEQKKPSESEGVAVARLSQKLSEEAWDKASEKTHSRNQLQTWQENDYYTRQSVEAMIKSNFDEGLVKIEKERAMWDQQLEAWKAGARDLSIEEIRDGFAQTDKKYISLEAWYYQAMKDSKEGEISYVGEGRGYEKTYDGKDINQLSDELHELRSHAYNLISLSDAKEEDIRPLDSDAKDGRNWVEINKKHPSFAFPDARWLRFFSSDKTEQYIKPPLSNDSKNTNVATGSWWNRFTTSNWNPRNWFGSSNSKE